jgi:flagellar motor switch/type III secretory pathway protein FliN
VSVATLSPRKQRQLAQSRAMPIAVENLAAVHAHALTNPLYRSRGLKANELTWYWHSLRPSRIREWVTLTADDTRIQIALDGEATGLGTEPRDWHQYTGDVRLLAWTAYHEPVLELLRAVFRRDWIPESLGDCDANPDDSDQADDVQAGFSIHAGDLCVGRGLVVFGRDHIQTLAPRPDSSEPRPHALTCVRAVLETSLDEFEVPATELTTLHSGSVVRLDNRTLRTTPRVVIPLGTTRAIGEIHGKQVTIVGFAAPTRFASDSTSGARNMSDHDSPLPKPSDRAVDPATLPVTLRFIAGRTTVPFGALADVAPGFVFELDRPLDDQVITVLANEVPIAQGELVTLGDLLGVRISRMLPQP